MVRHGSFTWDVEVAAAPSEVYAAVERAELRSRWLRLPGRAVAGEAVDFAAAAHETVRAELRAGPDVERVERRTHVLDVTLDRRVVLAYEAFVDGRCRWVSLLTVEVAPHAVGTRLSWTEQYAFLDSDGEDDVAHLRGGTRLLLTGLAVSLGVAPRVAELRAPESLPR
jgi:uncharacterized protein YndB with AHSA1/START domain